MQALDDEYRKRLGILGSVLCSVSVLLLPIAARSSMELAGERLALEERFRLPVLPAPLPRIPLIVLRDPFRTAVPDLPAARGAEPDAGLADPLLLPLPPNRGAGENLPADFGSDAPMVRAVITGGASPRALVDENGQVRIVEIGDVVGGSKITVIDSGGIRLKNGARYAMSGDNT